MALTYQQVQSLMRQVGFPESEIVTGAAVYYGESNFNPNIVNPGVGAGGKRTNEYSVGIGQINTLVHKNYSVEQLKNPIINLTECLRIYRNDKDRNGNHKLWRSWGAYTDGRYKQYLPASRAAYTGDGGDGNPDAEINWAAIVAVGVIAWVLF